MPFLDSQKICSGTHKAFKAAQIGPNSTKKSFQRSDNVSEMEPKQTRLAVLEDSIHGLICKEIHVNIQAIGSCFFVASALPNMVNLRLL